MLKNLLKHWLGEGRKPRSTAQAGGPAPASDRPQRLARGLECLSQRRYTEAEQICRSLLADNPADGEALHLLGHVLRWQRKFDEAVETLRQSTVLAPQSAEARFSLGDALRAQHRYREAAEAFGSALALRPDFTGALVSLADMLTQLERVDLHQSLSERILKIGTIVVDTGDDSLNIDKVRHPKQVQEILSNRLGRRGWSGQQPGQQPPPTK